MFVKPVLSNEHNELNGQSDSLSISVTIAPDDSFNAHIRISDYQNESIRTSEYQKYRQ